jgi:hypothetical protein
MTDRLELKEDIMGCQGILDDLRILSWRLDDQRDQMDPEEIATVVRGIETLYEIKFRKLWEDFNAFQEKN